MREISRQSTHRAIPTPGQSRLPKAPLTQAARLHFAKPAKPPPTLVHGPNTLRQAPPTSRLGRTTLVHGPKDSASAPRIGQLVVLRVHPPLGCCGCRLAPGHRLCVSVLAQKRESSTARRATLSMSTLAPTRWYDEATTSADLHLLSASLSGSTVASRGRSCFILYTS